MARLAVHRRQRPQEGRRHATPLPRHWTRPSAASRSASSVRSPRTCPSWSRRPASRTSRSPTSSTRSTRRPTELKADGADVVVLLVHEGAPTPTAPRWTTDPNSAFGKIVNGVNDDVDAIVSGHTHLAYNCSFPVAGWTGRAGDRASGGLRRSVRHEPQPAGVHRRHRPPARSRGAGPARTLLHLKAATGRSGQLPGRPGRPSRSSTPRWPTADALGAARWARSRARSTAAKLADGTTENRGGESTLGNLVAEVQRWATETRRPAAQIAFMNPGGLRTTWSAPPGAVPARPHLQAGRRRAAVRQHAGEHGADRCADQDGARAAVAAHAGSVPSRPFLRLGVSAGFTYTYDPTRMRRRAPGSPGCGSTATPIEPATTYSVTVNSFLASGGDNFRGSPTAPASGTRQDRPAGDGRLHGRVRAPALTRCRSTQAERRRGEFPAGAPATYAPGDHVTFDVARWSITNRATPRTPRSRSSWAPPRSAGHAGQHRPATCRASTTGKASVDVVAPGRHARADHDLTLVGAKTGTRSR